LENGLVLLTNEQGFTLIGEWNQYSGIIRFLDDKHYSYRLFSARFTHRVFENNRFIVGIAENNNNES
jgi:hypothetical protein